MKSEARETIDNLTQRTARIKGFLEGVYFCSDPKGRERVHQSLWELLGDIALVESLAVDLYQEIEPPDNL